MLAGIGIVDISISFFQTGYEWHYWTVHFVASLNYLDSWSCEKAITSALTLPLISQLLWTKKNVPMLNLFWTSTIKGDDYTSVILQNMLLFKISIQTHGTCFQTWCGERHSWPLHLIPVCLIDLLKVTGVYKKSWNCAIIGCKVAWRNQFFNGWFCNEHECSAFHVTCSVVLNK